MLLLIKKMYLLLGGIHPSDIDTEQFSEQIIFSLIGICTFSFRAFSDMGIELFLFLASSGSWVITEPFFKGIIFSLRGNCTFSFPAFLDFQCPWHIWALMSMLDTGLPNLDSSLCDLASCFNSGKATKHQYFRSKYPNPISKFRSDRLSLYSAMTWLSWKSSPSNPSIVSACGANNDQMSSDGHWSRGMLPNKLPNLEYSEIEYNKPFEFRKSCVAV